MQVVNIETRKKDSPTKLPRAYVWPEGFNPIEDLKTGTRYNRPEQTAGPLVEAIAQAVYGGFAVKARWSQKAGCDCGCSPGFVLTPAVRPQWQRSADAMPWNTPDIHITVKPGEPYKRERKFTCCECGKVKPESLMVDTASDTDPDPDLGFCAECNEVEQEVRA